MAQKPILFVQDIELPPLTDGFEKSPHSSNPNRSATGSWSLGIFRFDR
jgi:hypothetical protein